MDQVISSSEKYVSEKRPIRSFQELNKKSTSGSIVALQSKEYVLGEWIEFDNFVNWVIKIMSYYDAFCLQAPRLRGEQEFVRALTIIGERLRIARTKREKVTKNTL